MAPYIKIPRLWQMPEFRLTPESVYLNRRDLLRRMGFTGLGLMGWLAGCRSSQEVEQQIQQRAQALATLQATHNATFTVENPLTEEKVASRYNVVRLELTEQQPATFWNTVARNEYDFLANVNPRVPHPRWSQASERVIGSGERRPTLLYNGYAQYVGHLYNA